ncbi:histidine phosphatase family protein [Formicincola oecophyllae]|uniref:Histidine phosphatase family protein n=2 Tax=Formicincola oecophyllae TaxID=2558361 RepID=A0A4Y6UD06_9PROT|nr:histidine phosphatase family protein [Formicincola oecophyllae]QDH14366.1 histidine phosphatase family protein [Formicincola oecophyllae]
MIQTPSPVEHDPQASFLDGPGLPSGVTRFWLVRHGVVTAQARQTMYGSLDVPLCQDSLRDHEPAFRDLAQRVPEGALWFSSPLQRAHLTARAIMKHRPGAEADKEPALVPGVIEQSIGAWNGLPHEDFAEAIKGRSTHPFWGLGPLERPPGGESMADVEQRVGLALSELADAHPGRDMVVVSHGGAIRMALAFALGIGTEPALRFTIQNLSISIVERIGGQWRVVGVNIMPAFEVPQWANLAMQAETVAAQGPAAE